MRRSLIILMVCVLVIGGIGATFATGMTFSNVGALSLKEYSVPQVNVDYLYYHIRSDTECVVEAILTFDGDLGAGSHILIALLDSEGTVIDQGFKTLDYNLHKGSTVTIVLNGQDQLFESICEAKVTVAPSFVP